MSWPGLQKFIPLLAAIMSPDVADEAGHGWQLAPENGPHSCYHGTMSARRGWGEDGIFFEHRAPCRDSERHRHCKGRWRGSVSLGFGPDGKRIRRKVSGKTKAIVQDRLKKLHDELETGVRASPDYTVRRAAEDWLREGLAAGRPRRSRRTRTSWRRSWQRSAPGDCAS